MSKLTAMLIPKTILALDSFFKVYIAFPKKSNTVENNNIEKKNPLV